jgi:hypothetical protein
VLAAREAQGGQVAAERLALRADLERLLRERGTLDSLRRVVAAAMESGDVAQRPDQRSDAAVAAAAAGAAASRRPPPHNKPY